MVNTLWYTNITRGYQREPAQPDWVSAPGGDSASATLPAAQAATSRAIEIDVERDYMNAWV